MGFANTDRTKDDSRDGAQLQRKSPIIFAQNVPLLVAIVLLTILNLRNFVKVDSYLGDVDTGNPLTPQVRFPPPTSKWLEDFVMNGRGPLCGTTKCLYRSRSSRYNADTDADQERRGPPRKEYGYMVSQAKHKEWERAQRVFLAWEKIQSLSEQFSVQHLFLGPPVPYNCSKPLAKRLNKKSIALVTKSADNKVRSARYYPTDPKKLNATQLLVQPIEFAPKDSILFGCFPNKAAFAKKKLVEYFANDSNRSSTSPTDPDLLAFNETLEFGFRSTVNMMKSAEGSCMLKDFQVLVDPLSGRIYQFDIERCFEHPSASKFKSCRNHFRRFITDLKQCKRGPSCHPRE